MNDNILFKIVIPDINMSYILFFSLIGFICSVIYLIKILLHLFDCLKIKIDKYFKNIVNINMLNLENEINEKINILRLEYKEGELKKHINLSKQKGEK